MRIMIGCYHDGCPRSIAEKAVLFGGAASKYGSRFATVSNKSANTKTYLLCP